VIDAQVLSMWPNILFFLSDQHRSDWLGCNPDLPLRTPNLDRLSATGIRFRNAYTPSPLCAPARACLASGLSYDRCRVPSNRESYPLDQPTYYQSLRDAGYRVCGVGKFDLHKDLDRPPSELDWHLDGSRLLAEWGFTEGIDNEGKLDGSNSYRAAGRPKAPYLNFLRRQGLADTYVQEHADRGKHRDAYVTALPAETYCDNWIAGNGLRFLRNFPDDQPWHLVVNFAGPHNPMDVTQCMHDAWHGVEFPVMKGNHERAVQDYSKHLAINPTSVMAHFNKAQSLKKLGRTSEAAVSFRKAIQIGNPSVPNEKTLMEEARKQLSMLPR